MEFPVDSIANRAVETIFATQVNHQELFYVHVESRSKILDDITEKLEQKYQHLLQNDQSLRAIKIGNICAAKFNDDDCWYRAKITGILQSGLIEVNFVDYGNTDFVERGRLKELDTELLHYPLQAYRCALACVIKGPKDHWSPEHVVQLEDLVIEKKCTAVFRERREPEGVYEVDLFDADGQYVNHMFGAPKMTLEAAKSGAKASQPQQRSSFQSLAWQVGDKTQATVVFVKDPSNFWCQEDKFTNEIVELSESLSRSHMRGELQPLRNIAPGTICAAKFSEDDSWYRGIVENVSRDKARVYFVDYGNTESVDIGSICELNSDKRILPALAVKCCLANIDDGGRGWGEDVIEELENFVVDKEFEVTTKGKLGDAHIVTLFDVVDSKDVATQLKPVVQRSPGAKPAAQARNSSHHNGSNSNNNNLSSSSSRGAEAHPTKSQSDESGPILQVGDEAEVFLSWIVNPGDFWVQRDDAMDLLEKLSGEIQEYYSQPRPLAQSAPGAFVVARFSEDQMWYRGLVLKETEEKVRVLFIDYGNSDLIFKTELRQVTPQLGTVFPLAFRCSLLGVKPLKNENSWSVDAKDFLEKLTENGCMAKVVKENDNHRFVKLFVNGKDVAQELVSLAVVSDAHAPSGSQPQVPLFNNCVHVSKGQKETVTVTHVDSPSSFWCQLSSNNDKLDLLMEKLDSHYSDEGGTPVSKALLGQACIAQYSEDEQWYRANIIRKTANGYEVQFIDYGNTESVAPGLVCVPEPRFLDLPMQAVQCSLPLTGDNSNLSVALTDLTAEKELMLDVLDVSGDIAVVELFDQGKPISSTLKSTARTSSRGAPKRISLAPASTIPVGSSFSAYASVTESPDKFFLQKAGVDQELESLMEKITSLYSSGGEPVSIPSVGQFCVAQYSEDDQWYRGRITAVQGDSCTVLFVDYGNEESINMGSIKQLQSEISSQPIMAYQCSLEGVKSGSCSQPGKDLFEGLVMDQELKCTFMKPGAVKMTANGQDIASQLINSGKAQASQASSTQAPSFHSPAVKEGDGGWGEPAGSSASGGFGGSRSPKKNDSGSGFGGRGDGGSNFLKRDGNEESSSGGKREGGGSSFGGNRGGGGGSFGESGGGGGSFGSRDRKPANDSGEENTTFVYADPPSSPETALLVHMDADGTFYLQLPSMESDIMFLSKRLAGSYKDGRGPRMKEDPVKGAMCCAKFPDDGSMYRGLIEEANGNQILVRYVDYGNTAECTPYDLKMLFPDLLRHAVQAFPCKLRGFTWTVDQAEKFAQATLDKELEVTFTSTSKPFEVDLKTPDGDLLGIMTGKIAMAPPKPKVDTNTNNSAFGSKPAAGGSPPKPSGGGSAGGFGGGSAGAGGFGAGSAGFGTSTPKKPDAFGVKYSISSKPKVTMPNQVFSPQSAPTNTQKSFISHVSKDGFFYVQLEKDTDALDGISEQLGNTAEWEEKHPSLSVGASCAALFSEDSSWYRAIVTKKEGSKVEVTFVDFGNGDSIDVSNVKPLTSNLLDSPPLAYQCQFEEVGPLSVDGQTRISEYLMEHEINTTFLNKKAPFCVSAGTVDLQDLQEIACPSNQYRSPIIPTEVVPAGVSYIEEDGRFFIQLFKEYRNLKKLEDSLRKASDDGSFLPLEACEEGAPCCFATEDGSWYRSKVIEVTDDSVTVLCVDYGYTKSVSKTDLKASLPQFLKKPVLAIECRLKGVQEWTEDLKEKFLDMTQDKILNTTFFSKEKPYQVSMARSIELDLLGLNAPVPDSPTKTSSDGELEVAAASNDKEPESSAYITHVDPSGTLYVQLTLHEDALATISDSLEEQLATPTTVSQVEVGMSLCAKFTEDNAWYRATVEQVLEGSQYLVRFIDYGNTDTVSSDRLAVMPESVAVSVTPAFALAYSLHGLSSALNKNMVNQLRDLVTDVEVKVEFESDKVKVTVEGQNVFDTLQFDNLAPACPGMAAFIPHVETCGTLLYVQLASSEDALATQSDLLEELLAEAEPLEKVEKGASVCAKFTEDDMWYRAKIVQVIEDGQYLVRFLDYGNTDTVGADRLAHMPESVSLDTTPAFATAYTLHGLKSALNENQVNQLRDLVTDVEVKVDIVSGDKVKVTVEGQDVMSSLLIKDENIDLNETEGSDDKEEDFVDTLEYLDTAGTTVEGNSEVVSMAESPESNDSLSSGQRVALTISVANSPDSFFFQLDKQAGQLDTMMDSMFDHFTSLPEGEGLVQSPKPDDLCAALFEDESWYRVKVKAVNEDETIWVSYIDHGNMESADLSSLRVLPDTFRSIPTFCMCGRLGGVMPKDGEWTTEAVAEFAGMVEEKSLLADVLKIEENVYTVHILEMGMPVHDELIKKDFAVASLEAVVVSKSVQQKFDPNDTTLNVTQDNDSTQNDTNNLPKGSDTSCLESTHLEGHAETAKAAMMTSGAHARQKMGCVSSKLVELEDVPAYVSHTQSPTLFWCQLSSATDVLDTISASLTSIYSTPEVSDKISGDLEEGDIVVAISAEDEELYRSKVIKDYKDEKVAVRFIDYGNESEVSRNKIFKIRDELCQTPTQAFACCLDKVKPVDDDWSSSACDRFSELVTDQELSLKLVGCNAVGVALVNITATESKQSIASVLIDEAVAEAAERESVLTSKDGSSQGNMSEMSSLEITHPIMESTTVGGHMTPTSALDSISYDKEGEYRYVRLGLHAEYDVKVCNSETLNSFSIQLKAMKSQFSSLMTDIAEHVVADSFEEVHDVSHEADEPCLVQRQGVWYRGIVVGAAVESKCNVRSVDCGWESSVPTDELKPLPVRFLDLPAQAVTCYLAGVVSVEDQWCEDAVSFFTDFVKDNKVIIHVLENAEDGKYGVYISDLDNTSSSINRALVDLGYAEVVPGSNIEVQIEMEKTLDTDMLDDLEVSFNEVKDQKDNSFGDGKEAQKSEVADSLAEAQEESSLRNDLSSFNKDIYRLVHINADDKPEAADEQNTQESDSKGPVEQFSLADNVERIAQLGCVDPMVDGFEGLSTLEEVDESKTGADAHGLDNSGASLDDDDLEPRGRLYTWKSKDSSREEEDLKLEDEEEKDVFENAENGTAEDSGCIPPQNSTEGKELDESRVSSDPPSFHEDCDEDGDDLPRESTKLDFEEETVESELKSQPCPCGEEDESDDGETKEKAEVKDDEETKEDGETKDDQATSQDDEDKESSHCVSGDEVNEDDSSEKPLVIDINASGDGGDLAKLGDSKKETSESEA